MYDFETLVGELLQTRPELDRQELMRRIEQKKQTVGAGYLTDQGALFLVAGELGVSLRKEEASADMSVKDLYIGANDVTVVARVLALYPEATYNKKAGGTGKYRRLVLFDGSESVRLTAWEEKADEVEKARLQVDSAVRVVSGYVKQGLDGKPNLNLGNRGRIEAVSDAKIEARLPTLSAATEKLTKISQERQFTALECVVSSEPRFSEFTRSDGSQGSLFQFGAVGDGGAEVRIVVWSPSARPELKKGQRVVVTNVRARRSSNGEFEVHGDAGTVIMEGPKAERVQLRVAAVLPGSSPNVVLALDKNGKAKVVELGKGIQVPPVGTVIGVVPDIESEGRLRCTTPGSVEAVNDDSFLGLAELATKLRNAKVEGAKIMVEVIALSHGTVDDVRLRDGSSAKKGELVVGDDTDEMKVVAWRDLAGRLSGIQPGERLRVVGIDVKSTKAGAWLLEVSSITAVEKLKGRA
jgi:ssDNA-binding replication factor A large subunit